MHSHRDESPQEFGKYEDNNSSKIFSCIRPNVNTGTAMYLREKLVPQEFLSCVYWFCARGYSEHLPRACYMGRRTIIVRYVARWRFARLCETKYQKGYRTILGECKPPEILSHNIGSQYRALWDH